MCDLTPSACGCALDVLWRYREEERARDEERRPDGFLDRGLLAGSAARTRAALLRESIWLRSRSDSAALGGTQSHTHAHNENTTQGENP